MFCICRRTACGSVGVRATTTMSERNRAWYDRYMNSLGSSPRLVYLPVSTTPITVRSGPRVCTVLPRADSPGQNRSAKRLFTTMTGGPVGVVGAGIRTALHEIDAHRLQVSLANVYVVDVARLVFSEVVAGNGDAGVTGAQPQRQLPREPHVGHLWKRADRLRDSVQEITSSDLLVALQTGVQRSHDDVLGLVESRVDLSRALQTPQEEARADQEQQRQRHLQDDQGATHPGSTATLAGLALYRGDRLGTRRLQCRQHPEKDSSRHGDRQGEPEHRAVDLHIEHPKGRRLVSARWPRGWS